MCGVSVEEHLYDVKKEREREVLMLSRRPALFRASF